MEKKKIRNISFRALFANVFILIGAVPTVVFAILVLIKIDTSMFNNQISAMHQIANMLTDHIDQWADESIVAVEDIAYSQMIASGDLDVIRTELKGKVAHDTSIKNIMYVDVEGNVLADGIGSVGKNVKDTSYFADTLTGYTHISDVYEEDGSKVINFSVPIVDQGKMRGVVISQIEIDKIKRIVGQVTLSEDSKIFTFNKKGDITWQSTDETFFEGNLLDESNKALFEGASNALKGKRSHIIAELGNEKAVIVYDYVPALGWGTMTTISYKDFYSGITEVLKVMFLVMLAIILAIAVLLIVGQRAIVKPIYELAHLTEQVADGNLSMEAKLTRIEEIWQIGNAFNKMINALKTMIHQINEKNMQIVTAVENLNHASSITGEASNEINCAMEEIVQGATLQASKTEYVLENTKELDEKSKEARLQLGHVDTCLQDLRNCVQDAQRKSEQLAHSTEVQKELIDHTTEEVKSLDTAVSHIHQIIEIIDGISDQTHLLSLNASIEAARAGESGKGFSVVAQEIGKLAIESHQATENISQLLQQIASQTKVTTDTMAQIVESMEVQNQDVAHTRQSFKEIEEKEAFISEGMDKFEKVITYISDFSEKLIGVVDELSGVAANSAAVTEETTASTQEQMSMIESLNQSTKDIEQQFKELQQSIEHFKVEKENV